MSRLFPPIRAPLAHRPLHPSFRGRLPHGGPLRSAQLKRTHWGLPGGHIEYGEAPEDAVRREIQEELRIAVPSFGEVGDYRYKGAFHRVFTAVVDRTIEWFDRGELLEVAWHPLEAIEGFAREQRLHAGYELDAIRLLALDSRLRF